MWFLLALVAGWGSKIAYDRYREEEKARVPKALPLSTQTVLGRLEEAPRLARGDDATPSGPILPSPLPGVSSGAWTKFCQAMRLQKALDIGPTGAIGIFGLMPKRLEDLGFAGTPKRVFDERQQKLVWVAGDFVPPLTVGKFRQSPLAQYNAMVDSMKDYLQRLRSGELRAPEGLSESGALAVLHRAGPRGLEEWASGRRFKPTEKTVAAANGLF